jgi:hypothetical protein
MRPIQRTLNNEISKMPELVLQEFLKRKLKEVGSPLPPEGIAALMRHIMSGNTENFVWDDKDKVNTQDHTISFDDKDEEEIIRMVEKLTSKMPDIIDNVSKKTARDIFKTLRAKWTVEGAIQAYETDEFRQRLEDRWGEGLDLLCMLLTVCREIGSEANKRYRRSKSKKHQFRRFVLIRLQSRACQVADEIITLMENGFANGAMARWRTLHEIAVIVTLIENGDEELAERYILHDAVDRKREADEYERTQVPIGYAPLAKSVRKELEKNYAEALKRFGEDFKGEYGWASSIIKGRATFRRLQEEAGREGMTSYYKLASYNIHVGAHSMFNSLTNIGNDEILLAGRSNAGLLEPGQNTAFSLVQITASLTQYAKDMDYIIQQTTVIEIRDAITKAFANADRKLRKDEVEFQKSCSKSARAKHSRHKRAEPASD